MNPLHPTPPPGWHLVALDTVDSTNDEALRRAAAGAASGTIVWARAQTAGRGRRGRAWLSPPGNLHLSILTEAPSGGNPGRLAFLAALAVVDALDSLMPTERRFALKWPNDILLDDRKLGGILIETALDGRFVIGIGVNVAHAPPVMEPAAAALSECGVTVALAALAAGIARAFAAWQARLDTGGFAPVRDAWLARAAGLGRPVTARLAGRTLTGVFADLDEDGALVLAQANGSAARIRSCEVFFGGAPD